MIRCNLSVLLAERNLKITRVSDATGISRTTLTALTNNKGRGIQFDTINTLCNYLKTTPDKLISYIPIDIKIKSLTLNDSLLEIDVEITKNLRQYICCLTGNCFVSYEGDRLVDLDINIQPFDTDLDPNNEQLIEENKILIDSFTKLTTPFRNDIENEIVDKILSKFSDDIYTDITLSFTWDNALIFS